MSNEKAPDGQVWLCTACAKRSRDLYGDSSIDYGWDESCIIHAKLYPEAEAERLHTEYYQRVKASRE